MFKHSAELPQEQCVDTVTYAFRGYEMSGHVDDSIHTIERTWWHAHTTALYGIIEKQKTPKPAVACKRPLTVEDHPAEGVLVLIWLSGVPYPARTFYSKIFGGARVLSGFEVIGDFRTHEKYYSYNLIEGWCPVDK